MRVVDECGHQLAAIGVYCILNTVNGKRYIGSTVDSFGKRWRWHRASLDKGTHHSVILQNAWNKYGAAAFEVSILLVTDRASAIDEEQRFIDMYQSSDRKHGYNVLPNARSRIGHFHSAESRKKMSDSKRGILKGPMSSDQKKKIGDANRGRVMTEDQRRKSGMAKRGKPLSPEHKEKLRIAHTGRRKSEEAIVNESNGRRNRPIAIAERIRAGRILLDDSGGGS